MIKGTRGQISDMSRYPKVDHSKLMKKTPRPNAEVMKDTRVTSPDTSKRGGKS